MLFNMYIPKFSYNSLTRQEVNGSRRYVAPDGERLPSVTTILEATKSEEKKQILNEWKRRVGQEKAKEITKEASSRGTKMHTFLEAYIKNGNLTEKPANPFHKTSWHMAETVINKGLTKCTEFWGTEISLYFPKIYAGTTDCVGVHDETESIIDFKQTNKPKKREWIEDYFLQLCAYAAAHNEVYNTNINRGVVMMCVSPEIDGQGNIIKSPEYQEFIIEGSDWALYTDKWWKRVEEYYLKEE